MTYFIFTKEMHEQAGAQPAGSTVLIGYKDNATSLRVKGPQAVSEGGADVQSYSGIFYNDAYAGTGTLKTRFVTGGNLEMDVEVQSPHQLRLTAVDDSQSNGQIFASSRTNFVFNLRAMAEVGSPKQLIIDRVDKGTVGAANTSDVEVSVNTGNIVLASIPVLPSYTVATANLIAATAGAMIFVTDETGGPVMAFGDGTNWLRVTDRAIIA